jgi:dipeptidyl aminopeptidase/acylaminoacyl peptidase
MPRKPISPEDIYEIRQPLQCRISPQGDRLLVVVSQPDKEQLKNASHLWMVPLTSPPAAADRTPDGEDEEVPPPPEPAQAFQFTQGKDSESSPRWSPDGSTIAFLSRRSGKTEVWTMPARGGEARQLTRLNGHVSELAWHPKGRKLVVRFTPQDPEAKEREELKKQGKAGYEAPRVRQITRLFYKLDGAGFIPQGHAHLYLVDADTGRARPLTEDDRYDESEPRFSPDGKWLYFVSNRTDDPDLDFMRIDIWRMPARGGAIQKVRNFDGPSTTYSLSPDGRWLAFLGTPDPKAPWSSHHTKLYLTPAAGGRPVELTRDLDRACENSTISDTFGTAETGPPLWSPDGAWIYFVVTNEGNSEIWRVRPRGPKPEPVFNLPGAVIDFAIDFTRGWIHSCWSDLTNPGEVRSDPLPLPRPGGRAAVALPETTRQVRPIVRSELNSGWLSQRDVLMPEELWLRGRGGHKLQGWVLAPKGRRSARKRPGILYIHGGPAMQYGRVFFHEFQALAAAGYTVLYCNPRGGTGYSERHLSAIVNRWGTKDYDDLMVFTDTVLRRRRLIDRRRLAVAGGSYGGFMTNWIIGHTQRFACAVSSRSISNLMSFVGSSDFGYSWPQEFGSRGPWEDPRHYLRMSPLTYLRNMKTPTLIDHQEEDHRCPIEQAEQLWAALKVKGVPVEFLRYPAEPHGMSRNGRPDRRIDRLERILAWMEKWIGR